MKNNTKIVKVKIRYESFYEDIIEDVGISVPCDLSQEEEDAYIQNVVDDNYAFLYGR